MRTRKTAASYSCLEAECSYSSTVTWPQNIPILFLFEICIIYHKGINFHGNYFSQENLQTTFYFQEKYFWEETYFTNFLRIKFSKFGKKDILPVAVTFCMRLKKGFSRLARELICMI